ncbi:MAG: GNAT family N-acetyltransferase [Crocinitomicaceae bacterium]|nr:GNAT family N-acetyltransferase [Crocinitomicaceae bacterium]
MINEDITLENDRVMLVALKSEHITELLEYSINQPDLWEFSLTRGDGEENLRNYIQMALNQRKAGTSYPFIVFDKKNGKFAGSTRFYDYQKHHNTVQLGYTWYGKEFQRTGLNRNCKLLLLSYAFEELKLNRVEFRADAKNKRSIIAMKAIGCTEEGILRQNCSSPEGRRDSIILSILNSEWKDVKPRLIDKIYG